MPKDLFKEFETVSSKQWKQQIQFELKGADYNDTLIWNSPEAVSYTHLDVYKRQRLYRLKIKIR